MIQAGILTVTNLVAVTNSLQGFTSKSFNTIKSKLLPSIPLTVFYCIDNRKHDNPYLSLYNDNYLVKIKSTSAFLCTSNIKDLIDYILSETKKVFENTKYANNYFYYYNILTQIKNSTTMY